MRETPYTEYIGDSIYATYNRGQIELRLGDHRTRPVIYIEPQYLYAIVEFYQKQRKNAASEYCREGADQ